MSLNSVEEVRQFLTTIECGEPIFTINTSYNNSVSLALTEWKQKEELRKSDDAILYFIGNSIDRSYNIEDKTLKIDAERVLSELGDYIYNTVIDMARETSTSDQPKRTLAHKDIQQIAYIHRSEELFINDVLPIINYYYQQKTDSKDKQDMVVHQNNVQALFGIIRKKYGKSISK